MLDIPILLIVFKRPDATRKVLNAIRLVKPRQLFVAADGPRPGHVDEAERCRQTRAVVEEVDWDCEVKRLFHDRNLGCGVGNSTGPPTAINWFFQNVERGIILEDDCVPDESFFYFCEELLERYRDSDRVMHIGGNNFQRGRKRGRASYYFSRYTHIWGWATWRRAWSCFGDSAATAESNGHVWDKTWMLAVQKRGGLSVVPNVNLVTNIGFGMDATHTNDDAWYARLPAEKILLPLRHPASVRRHRRGDIYTHHAVFGNEVSPWRILRRQALAAIRNVTRPAYLVDRLSYWLFR